LVLVIFVILAFNCTPGNGMGSGFPGTIIPAVGGIFVLLPGRVESLPVDILSMRRESILNILREVVIALIRHDIKLETADNKANKSR
jgi:hypothetical protein